MAIPALDQDGRLPPGRHVTSLPEIADLFVERAPNRERRRLIFDAFEVYTRIVANLLPGPPVLWVNGGFVTHKAAAPKDIDLVVVVDTNAPPGPAGPVTMTQLLPLITQSNLEMDDRLSGQGRIAASVMNPMGGLVDAYLVTTADVAALGYWDRQWSQVTGAPGVIKGYLEVAL